MPDQQSTENSKPSKDRLVVTLTGKSAAMARELATDSGTSSPEIVRRALSFYRYMKSLEEDEEMRVYNRKSGESGRIFFFGDL